ncbi:phage baseplate assembly protein V [Endozoicomonas sp. SM1973]|uniref:Phage baseplate assembly protein V n=1 Tax=Spartinivicinus marinus TaxID=2994442 RepID=A0A853I845_9GAMM|nr:phage baseplate assembly protein V [Spartinivicinus marinus]MCX4025047.1 phage baseplate assembly protein V [Spartinivicinus marinus]NYZ68999.1 phage baseplate assembly protein V [Spartinivicinus marinus]
MTYSTDDVLFRLTELERQLANLVLIATVSDVDFERSLVQATSAELVTGWLPWVTHRAANDVSYWAPEIGEQVVVLNPQGEPALGVVLPALYQNKFPALDQRPSIHRVMYADGAIVEYDREISRLVVQLPTAGTVHIVSPSGLSIEGDVYVEGQIKATQDIIDHTRSMQGDRDIYNGHGHDVPGHGTAVPTGAKQ